MSIPANLKYTKSHEWVRSESDGTLTIGITAHAQELLGDMVFVETPEVGVKLDANQECAVVESVKAASDIYAPVSGTVVQANSEVVDSPEKINADPYGNWLFKIKPENINDVNNLLDADGYQAVIDSEG